MMIDALEKPAICIDSAKWGASMMRWEQARYRAQSEWAVFEAMPEGHPDRHILSDLCDQSGADESAAEDVLLAMPAPHLAALRWKLDRILTFHDNDGGVQYMDAYSLDSVRQTLADYKRLLPESA